MKKSNIILTGFMGAGKSAVGRNLAKYLHYQFIDTDRYIEQQTGLAISDIFTQQGEGAFREMEATLAIELAERRKLVIATGGGLLLNPANVTTLEGSGRIFCLTAAPEEIIQRLSSEHAKTQRPLLQTENPEAHIRELMRQRAAAYAQFPQVDTSGKTPRQVAGEINKLLKKSSQHP